ncbi:SKP1-like protein 1A [Chenopodium quinoa]|uniref:SKP1-like protein n=1 Tax=Chenopodium quinoa TaxID=63459 RepID=A0A803LSS7_CHEQI|nr:SKP1-like protein 1A [Chenopodium quinoa]
MASSRKIILQSSEKKLFEISENAAMLSETVKNMIKAIGESNDPIPVKNVSSTILLKIIDYCNKHVEEENDDVLKQWDADFLKLDQDILFDLILAANYMEIKSLLDLTSRRIADMIKDMTPEEIRKEFNIKNDYTPEEEEKLLEENKRAFK